MLGHLTSRDVTAIQIDMMFDGNERQWYLVQSIFPMIPQTYNPPKKW